MAVGIAVLTVIVVLFVAAKALDNRLDVIEQKLDQLLEARSPEDD